MHCRRALQRRDVRQCIINIILMYVYLYLARNIYGNLVILIFNAGVCCAQRSSYVHNSAFLTQLSCVWRAAAFTSGCASDSLLSAKLA